MATAVNVMDIVDARSQEITAAFEALKTNLSSSAKVSIPFHMRRRAASHNPKRLPARLRFEHDIKTKGRFKWKEKRERKEGREQAQRLETHFWHAKRCHMSDLWGYRLATSTTARGERAAYRATNVATTIQDTSFYEWFSVSSEGLHNKLEGLLVPNVQVPHRVISTLLYHKEACLGPVTVLWLSDEQVFIRIHPAITHSCYILSVFEGLQVKTYADKLSQFTFGGVKSLELLVKTLQISEETADHVLRIWNELSDDPFRYQIMNGTAIGIDVKVPAPEFRPYSSVTDSPVTQPRERLVPGPDLVCEHLFEQLQTEPMEAEGDPPSSIPSSLSCCLYSEGGRLTLLLPRGTGTRLWVPLTYSGARVIGLSDVESLNADRSIPSFPVDYPDTAAGRAWWHKTGEELQGKEERRPPQKRVGFAELGIVCPFRPDLSVLCGGGEISVIRDPGLLDRLDQLGEGYENHLIPVSVTCPKRGNMRPGAHLYLPFSSPHSSPSNLSSPSPPSLPSPTNDPVYSPTDSYPLVGFLTSAKFCLSSGKGGGLGLMRLSVFRTAVEGKLLGRNTTTKQYRYVRVKPL